MQLIFYKILRIKPHNYLLMILSKKINILSKLFRIVLLILAPQQILKKSNMLKI